MENDSLKSLTGAVTALARDAIRVQERFDRAAKQEAEAFAILLAQAPDALAEVLRPLAPTRLRVDTHKVTASFRVATTHTTRLDLAVRPLNLGYRLARRSTLEADATLVVEVTQIPSPHRTRKGVIP